MVIITEDTRPQNFNEMATTCHPKDNGGRFPMYIRVEYTNGEHSPPHAHLYGAEKKPSKATLITKFLITPTPPQRNDVVGVMKGYPEVPPKYASLIKEWAKGKNRFGVNNWVNLLIDWDGLEKTFR